MCKVDIRTSTHYASGHPLQPPCGVITNNRHKGAYGVGELDVLQ